jgi:uncharacterized protein (TIGR02284 family)
MPEHIALERVESTLNELIGILHGNHDGFMELGHRLRDNRVKRLFLEETQARAEYAAELENELHRMGVHDVKTGTSLAAKASHLWGESQASLEGGQKALLSAAEKDDDVAIETYESALKEELPLPLRELLRQQLKHIRISQDEIRALHYLD